MKAEQIANLRAIAEGLKDADPSDYSTEKAWDKYRDASEPSTIIAMCDELAASQRRVEALEAANAELCTFMDDPLKVLTALRARLAAAEAALKNIAAIENEMYGGDWDEIERARQYANNYLAPPPARGAAIDSPQTDSKSIGAK